MHDSESSSAPAPQGGVPGRPGPAPTAASRRPGATLGGVIAGLAGLAALLVLWQVFGLLVRHALAALAGPASAQGGPVIIAAGALAALPTGIVVLLAWRIVVGRSSWRRLGLTGGPLRFLRDAICGSARGASAMLVIVGTGLLAGAWGLHVPASLPSALTLLGWAALLIPAAGVEEVLLRGHLLAALGRDCPLLALTASCILFAGLHASNPGLPPAFSSAWWIALINVALAGAWLGAEWLAARSLVGVTGLHFGWNAAQGLLCGLPVSGVHLPSVLRAESESGTPAVLSGGAFGPEASLLATPVLAGLTALAVARLVRRSRFLGGGHHAGTSRTQASH